MSTSLPSSDLAQSLHYLQDLQQRFDRERGLHGPGGASGKMSSAADALDRPAEGHADGESQLRAVEFDALALAGEVGELANCVKKARRAVWTRQNSAPFLQGARAEVPDILAYLFKLSNDLGVNLVESYLEKMCDNCLRFPSRMFVAPDGKVLCIAGPSGVGKTTIALKLKADLPTFIEDVSNNPHLPKLLSGDPEFDAAANQQWFLDRHVEFLQSARSSPQVVMDQDPAGIVRVYAQVFVEQSRMSRHAYQKLLLDLLEVESTLTNWRHRQILFLDAPAEVLRERIHQRQYPQTPPLAWFQRLRDGFRTLADCVRNPQVVSTSELSVDQVVAAARDLLR